jgi:lactoylglutathione lyase
MSPTLDKAFGYRGNALALPVPSLADALPFYESKLGFRVESRGEGPAKSAVIARDAVRIGLAENDGDPTQDGCAFHVTGLRALFDEYRVKGAVKDDTIIDTEHIDGIAWTVFYVVAPDGLCYWFGERRG